MATPKSRKCARIDFLVCITVDIYLRPGGLNDLRESLLFYPCDAVRMCGKKNAFNHRPAILFFGGSRTVVTLKSTSLSRLENDLLSIVSCEVIDGTSDSQNIFETSKCDF